MCCNVSRQYCCVFIGVVAIAVGLADSGYKYYQLATLGVEKLILAMVVTWNLIILAAVLLIKIRFLLLIWIVVSLIGGVVLVIIKIMVYACYFSNNPDLAYHIFGASSIILFILLIFLFVYFPYAYRRELEEEQYE
ncbi:hypothetical protein KR084_012977 [Drosophila pseudotakahashii]|nr:hypothetical protein KR084_012977 [Drosophila pseudotakahashii]